MQQVNHRTVRRGARTDGTRADGTSPLPQFDLGRWDAFDPDRTLERLQAIPEAAPTPLYVAARREGREGRDRRDDHVGAASSDADMAITVEIAPEIDADDILEAAPQDRSQPVVLPPLPAAPFDLDRLLAQAREETRKSVDFFHPSTPLPASVGAGFAGRAGRADPTLALRRTPTLSASLLVDAPRSSQASRRRLGWVLATVLAAAVATIAVAAVQSSVSSARSPSSVTVTTATAAPTPVRAPVAPTNEIPTMAVQNLPYAPTATISLAAVAAAHRLFIDGQLAGGDSQVVSCGRHLVQVGSRGARRYVDVACGQELVVAN